MNILFLNAGRRCELLEAFREALSRRGGGMAFATDIDPAAPALYKADGAELLPHSSAPEFPEALSGFCKAREISLLIPSIDPDLELLDARREELQRLCPGLKLLIPPSFTIRKARDKRESKKLFSALGAKTPDDASGKAEEFPVFVKPPHGSASAGARRIDSPEELQRALAPDPDLIVERLVEGPEYTVDVLCDFSGKAIAAVPRRRIKVRGGEVSQGVVEMKKPLIELAMRLAEGFKAEGPVTLQFRSPYEGAYVAMELNARMGGGLPLSIAAGADWPGMILDMLAGRSPNLNLRVRDGLMMSRHDSSVFIMPGETPLPAPGAPQKLARPPRLRDAPGLLKGVDAFIFDMDDTLYPERDFVMGGYAAAAKRAWDLLHLDIEAKLRALFESGRRGDLFTEALRASGADFDERLVQELVEAYRSHTPAIRPYPDVASIGFLRFKGHKTGLLSDGLAKVQSMKLKALGVGGLFDAAVLSDELGGPKFWKPSPEPYKKILGMLGAAPSSAIYVGDNPAKDFLGARQCGIKTLRIRRPGTEHAKCEPESESCAPDAEIESLRELEGSLAS